MKIPYTAFCYSYNHLIQEIITEIIVINPSDKKEYKCRALWDTGATISVINKKIIEELNLIPIGKELIKGVNSSDEHLKYATQIKLLPSKPPIDLITPIIPVVESKIGEDGRYDVIIGMNIISCGDFVLSNFKETLFSFSVPPNENKINLVDRANKLNPKILKKIK